MQLFVDYVQPLTTWLHDHSHWALFIAFLVSCAESLAIIGSIVPGSLTMTAIGILAGSGVMRIDLTLCFAALGAVAGDSASYAFGYVYSDRLTQLWPFNRYPKLIRYGQDFFTKHGGKSVLIGRFVGPLRSIIPLIAGMMRMPQLQFFFSNFLSAIGWAVLYVIPGYLIGTASHQLSSESAKRLMILIVVLLVGIWLGGKGIQWFAHVVNRWYARYIRTLYLWSRNHAYLKVFFRDLRDDHAENQATVALLFLWLICAIISVVMILGGIQGTWFYALNQPVLLFLYSVKTQLFDIFFIAAHFIISPINLFAFLLVLIGTAIYGRDWRLLRFWLSLILTTYLTIRLLSTIPIPTSSVMHAHAWFLDKTLTWATALLTYTLFYLHEILEDDISALLRLTFLMLLILAGFGNVYLGDSCLSSVIVAYFVGISISLIHWVVFQRRSMRAQRMNEVLIFSVMLMLLLTVVQHYYYFRQTYNRHLPRHKEYALSEEAWWSQKKPLLPLYTTNRIGKQVGLFNIQYVGSLGHLEQQLRSSGWQKQSNTWLYSLLLRVNGQHKLNALPLMEQLYLNKPPMLIMTYNVKKNGSLFLLRLWLSNYYLDDYEDPIWLGSVIHIQKKKGNEALISSEQWSTLVTPIYPAIKHYQVRSLPLNDLNLKSMSYVLPAALLIIKNDVDV